MRIFFFLENDLRGRWRADFFLLSRVTRDNKRRSDEDNVESSPSHEAVLLPVTRTHAAFVSKLYTYVFLFGSRRFLEHFC